MAKITFRTSVLSEKNKHQILALYDKRRKSRNNKTRIAYSVPKRTALNGVFGELHFWR